MTRLRIVFLSFLAALLLAQDSTSLALPETLVERLPEAWRDVSRRLVILTQANINDRLTDDFDNLGQYRKLVALFERVDKVA